MRRRGAGMDENKRRMEALCTKVGAQVKEHQHDTNKQLNQVRLELARHLQLPAIHASSSASVVQGEHAAPDDSASTQQAAHNGALEHDDDALQLLPGNYKSRHGARRSPLTSPAPAPGSETMPLDLVAPARLSPGAPAGLGARLQLKRCISDDAVPASLRCAAIVVGNRLFLFPKGRDGMCDLQFAMVMDVDSLRLWALRVMGSLPLRCRCAFVVVKDSICVFPCDAAGRLDLRQTFVLTSADEDRVYSQVGSAAAVSWRAAVSLTCSNQIPSLTTRVLRVRAGLLRGGGDARALPLPMRGGGASVLHLPARRLARVRHGVGLRPRHGAHDPPCLWSRAPGSGAWRPRCCSRRWWWWRRRERGRW